MDSTNESNKHFLQILLLKKKVKSWWTYIIEDSIFRSKRISDYLKMPILEFMYTQNDLADYH